MLITVTPSFKKFFNIRRQWLAVVYFTGQAVDHLGELLFDLGAQVFGQVVDHTGHIYLAIGKKGIQVKTGLGHQGLQNLRVVGCNTQFFKYLAGRNSVHGRFHQALAQGLQINAHRLHPID
ncbi:protease subunit of ATp-dependent Clp proteases [Moorella thermoacetica Y72]|uniref:Protease subunit of ATp-dependent Clp proteases n=1 Tax=Moorella thermoacetica Y72 TaxID=1325331 RepID=A0A0S6U9W1_NEOTH|nr:protease subunit of ATp-dependent Clp proteases [Moorella thermoacetica Y72]